MFEEAALNLIEEDEELKSLLREKVKEAIKAMDSAQLEEALLKTVAEPGRERT